MIENAFIQDKIIIVKLLMKNKKKLYTSMIASEPNSCGMPLSTYTGTKNYSHGTGFFFEKTFDDFLIIFSKTPWNYKILYISFERPKKWVFSF